MKIRILTALLLFSLLGAMGLSLSNEPSETFNPDVLETMSPSRIGKCRLSNGTEAYCEMYERLNDKILLAIYMPHDNELILVIVKEMNKDGSNQRNIWTHELTFI